MSDIRYTCCTEIILTFWEAGDDGYDVGGGNKVGGGNNDGDAAAPKTKDLNLK